MITKDDLLRMRSGDIHSEAEIFETDEEAKTFCQRRRNSIAAIAKRVGVTLNFFNESYPKGLLWVGSVVVQKGDAQ